MHCSYSFLLISSILIGLVSADTPSQPKISETFSTWYVSEIMFKQKKTMDSIYEDKGFIQRDFQGARKLLNGTMKIGDDYMAFSRLIVSNKIYHTFWLMSNGTKNCYMESNTLPMQPIWSWVNESNYTGHAGNMDIWTSKYPDLNFTQVLTVPANNPNIPVEITSTSLPYLVDNVIYTGFDPTYKPNDSDFEIPHDCPPNGDLSSFHSYFFHIFDRHIIKEDEIYLSKILQRKMGFDN